MPLYKYECACGQILHISHTITEEPEIECNNCDGMMERKIEGVGGINFKGTGFYSTDQGGRGRS